MQGKKQSTGEPSVQLRFSTDQPILSHQQVLQVLDGFWTMEQVEEAYRYFKGFASLAESGNFWLEIAAIRDAPPDALAEALGLRCYFGPAAETLSQHLRRLLEILPRETLEKAVVLELWFTAQRKVKPSREVYLHTDSDHTAENWTDNVRLPMWGTVFYLGPRSGVKGGETTFCTESPLPEPMLPFLHESVPHEQALGLSRDWLTVPSKQNRLVVFRGALPHFSTPVVELASADEPRLVLVVAVWDHSPIDRAKLQRVSTMSPAEYHAACKLTETQLEELRAIMKRLTPAEFSEVTRLCERMPD
jgi:hypothetical protein